MSRDLNLRNIIMNVNRIKKWIFLIYLIVFIIVFASSVLNNYYDTKNDTISESANSVESSALAEKKSSVINQIERLRKEIINDDIYLENSILMSMEPKKIPCYSLKLFVETDAEIDNDSKTIIGGAYRVLYKDNELFDRVKSILGTNLEDRFIDEIIRVEYNPNNQVLGISVIHKQEDVARKIAEEIHKFTEQRAKEIFTAENYSPLIVLSKQWATIIDKELSDKIHNFEITRAENALLLENKEKELDEIEKNDLILNGSVSVRNESWIKKIVVALAAGTVFSIFLLILYSTSLNTPIHSSEVVRQYKIPILSYSCNAAEAFMLYREKPPVAEKSLEEVELGSDVIYIGNVNLVDTTSFTNQKNQYIKLNPFISHSLVEHKTLSEVKETILLLNSKTTTPEYLESLVDFIKEKRIIIIGAIIL